MANVFFEKGINAFLNGDVSWLRDSIRVGLLDLNQWAIPITDASSDTPIIVTTSFPNAFTEGDMINILGVQGNAMANGTHAVHVIDDSHFQLLDTVPSGAYIGGGLALNISTPEFLADVPAEALIVNSQLLSGKDIVKGVLLANDADFGVVDVATVLEAAVIYQDTGILATSHLLLYFDHGLNLPLAPNGTLVRLIWSPDGIAGLWL